MTLEECLALPILDVTHGDRDSYCFWCYAWNCHNTKNRGGKLTLWMFQEVTGQWCLYTAGHDSCLSWWGKLRWEQIPEEIKDAYMGGR